MMPSEWHDWHDFYMLLGTASAALVALLFVAVSIGATFLTPERSVATRTFMSPVVFHFSTLLLTSLIATVPSHTALSLAIGIALVAIAGLGYTSVVLVGLARASISDIADRFGYGFLPLASYSVMLAAASLAISRAMLAADILAGALLVLLAVNIRNAWDLMLAFAVRSPASAPIPERAPMRHDCFAVFQSPALLPLARLPIEKLALENRAKRRVRKAVEPSDWVQFLHVDIAIRHA
jgi:hypothetical protein